MPSVPSVVKSPRARARARRPARPGRRPAHPRNETDRLAALVEFVRPWGAWDAEEGCRIVTPLDDLDDDDATSARNLALTGAYRAIRRIAERS